MADIKNNSRNARTTSSIKRALLDLLNRKSLDAVTMSELAREAQVSRSTLYQHYGNVHEVYAAVVSDFDERVAPVMSQLECYEGIEPEGTLPLPKTMQFTYCGVPAPLLTAAPPASAVFPPMLQW